MTKCEKQKQVLAPLVSVVMPVYNGEKYLAEAIGSILKQTYADFEFIIVNDGSTDKSGEIIEKFAKKDHRIKHIKQPNKGLVAALNQGLAAAKGKYIARMDADDVSLPERFARQVLFLNDHPDYGLVGTWSQIWEEDRATTRSHQHAFDDYALRFTLFFQNTFVHSSTMYRRKIVEQVGGYRPLFNPDAPEDYDLWCRMAKVCKVANLPVILINYREVAGSFSRKPSQHAIQKTILISRESIASALKISPDNPEVVCLAGLMHSKLLPQDCSVGLEIISNLVAKLIEYICNYYPEADRTALVGIADPLINRACINYPHPRSKSFLIRLRRQLSGNIHQYKTQAHTAKSKDTFVYTEIYRCGKIGRVAVKSFFEYHPKQLVHIYGTLDDYSWLVRNPNICWHDLSAERKILRGFNKGHRGTALLWAKLIKQRQEKYLIHFDSDVIFRKESLPDITKQLNLGYDLVGQRRNYKNNPSHRKDIAHLADVTQTAFFGFNRNKINWHSYSYLTAMCQGMKNPLRHPVIDFFDPVMFEILNNGGKISFLDFKDYGGWDQAGRRDTNPYPLLNVLIDFGRKFVHFSAVGSGMNFYVNPDLIHSVPKSYLNYAIEKYALYCRLFYDEVIDFPIDEKIYHQLEKQFRNDNVQD